jgi:hypothetical protein
MEILGKKPGSGGPGIVLAGSGALQGAQGKNPRRQHVFTSEPSL